jgi:hypothetical protein
MGFLVLAIVLTLPAAVFAQKTVVAWTAVTPWKSDMIGNVPRVGEFVRSWLSGMPGQGNVPKTQRVAIICAP